MRVISGPDLERCFGHYRQQSVRYALQYCLECTKVKQCVRTAWGVDRPRRTRRDDWSADTRGGGGAPSTWAGSRESLAT